MTTPNYLQPVDRRGFVRTTATGGLRLWAASSVFSLLGSLEGMAAAESAGPALAPPDKQPADLEVPEPVNRKLGWAVVGLGALALGEAMPAFRECKYSRPVALVSGHPDKAVKVAAAYGIDPKNIYDYASYDRLAENPAVDVIYIVLPNSMHAEYTIRGLKAGKHVLCEKPMAISLEECAQMNAASKEADRKLGIAYRLHCEPMNQKVMDLCKKEAIGKIKTFTSSNCQTTKAPNIRLSSALGGGPVGDVGIYSINAARYTIREEPAEVTAVAHWPKDNPDFREVPETVSYTLRFPSGALATCDCSFGTYGSSRYRVLGTDGFIEMDPAFPYQGQRLHMQNREGGLMADKSLPMPPVNQFTAEFDAFSQAVLQNKPVVTDGYEGQADMKVVLAVMESLKTGQAVKIG